MQVLESRVTCCAWAQRLDERFEVVARSSSTRIQLQVNFVFTMAILDRVPCRPRTSA